MTWRGGDQSCGCGHARVRQRRSSPSRLGSPLLPLIPFGGSSARLIRFCRMPAGARNAASRLKRLRALKRLRVQRRHLKRALLATSPGIALLSGGSIPVAKLAVPFAVSATVPIGSEAVAAMSPAPRPEPAPEPPGIVIGDSVQASYYGEEFAGKPTASGEPFQPELLTAAHRTLPLGSLVQVTHAMSGRSVVVRVNDRGPFHGDRAIDLSAAAADQIGLLDSGTGKVTLRLLGEA